MTLQAGNTNARINSGGFTNTAYDTILPGFQHCTFIEDIYFWDMRS